MADPSSEDYTEKNLTLKSNLFKRSESTMYFVAESIRIRVDNSY